MRPEEGVMQSRAQAMQALFELVTNQPVIICNRFPSREAHKIHDRPQNFYMIGSMGVTASIGLGLALAQPEKSYRVRWGWQCADGPGDARYDWGIKAKESDPCGV